MCSPDQGVCSSSIVTPDRLLESEQAVWDEVGSRPGALTGLILGVLRLLRCRGREALCDPAGHLLQHGLCNLWEVVVQGVVAPLVDLNRSDKRERERERERE